MAAGIFQLARDRLAEVFQRERFGQIIISSGAHPGAHIRFVGPRADENERYSL